MTQFETEASEVATESQSIAEQFHRVASLIPADANLTVASPETSVNEAISLMRERGASQLAIVLADKVLGVFSYRSLADRVLEIDRTGKDIGELPIVEFAIHCRFMQPSDNWESVLDYLEEAEVVLVGSQEDLQGYVTALDVLRYLYEIASPFVMIAEIELALRRIIQTTTDNAEFQECVKNSLSHFYGEDRAPKSPLEMTFNDYIQVFNDGRNWPLFREVFGSTDWHRKRVRDNLEQVRQLRNVVFHFTRQLNREDLETLAKHRNWLLLRATTFDTLRLISAETTAKSHTLSEPESSEVWSRDEFLMLLQDAGQSSAISVVDRILSWAEANELVVSWNRDAHAFSVTYESGEMGCEIITVSTGRKQPIVQFNFDQLSKTDVLARREQREQLLGKINAIKGVDVSEQLIVKRPAIFLSRFASDESWILLAESLEIIISALRKQR